MPAPLRKGLVALCNLLHHRDGYYVIAVRLLCNTAVVQQTTLLPALPLLSEPTQEIQSHCTSDYILQALTRWHYHIIWTGPLGMTSYNNRWIWLVRTGSRHGHNSAYAMLLDSFGGGKTNTGTRWTKLLLLVQSCWPSISHTYVVYKVTNTFSTVLNGQVTLMSFKLVHTNQKLHNNPNIP